MYICSDVYVIIMVKKKEEAMNLGGTICRLDLGEVGVRKGRGENNEE